jgi:hypothetical protein
VLEDRSLPNNFFHPAGGLGMPDDSSAKELLAAVDAASATGNLGNPEVSTPQSHPFRQSYGQWSAT